MDILHFSPDLLAQLHKPNPSSSKSENGQLVVIAGSDLFHGPPLFILEIVTRMVDMVFFTAADSAYETWSNELKTRLGGFIWVPLEEIDAYIEKADATLIGPGMKRFRSEGSASDELDDVGMETKILTERLFASHPNAQWIVDAGSLQTIDPMTLPKRAIVTPNSKEYEMLFGPPEQGAEVASVFQEAAARDLVIVYKANPSHVTDGEIIYQVPGGNPGMTKGGTGDCLAALTAGLVCKNDPLLAAACGLHINQATADRLYAQVGPYYSSDDLSRSIPRYLFEVMTE